MNSTDLPNAADPLIGQAANSFTRAVLSRLKTEGGVHAESAIAAAAGMAGTYLLRSFALPIEGLDPGSPMFTEQSDEQGPALIKTIVDTLAENGIAIDPTRVPAQVPAEHRPQSTLLQIQLTVGMPFRQVTRQNRIDHRQAAFACAIATANIIKDTASVLDPHLAIAIAVRALTEGSKTVPVTIPGDDEPDAGGRKPWYKFW